MVREFGIKEEIEFLTWDTLDESDGIEVGWEMTALAVRIMNARSCYRYPSGNGFVYLLIADPTYSPLATSPAIRIEEFHFLPGSIS